MTPPNVTRDNEEVIPLAGAMRLIQRRKGHRVASDDMLLAGHAFIAAPDPKRILDLGSGKGTVALTLLAVTNATHCIGVEAYEPSHQLALRNAALNSVEHRYQPVHADLRTYTHNGPPFDLICGAPPFMPLGTGILPQDAQRAAGRFELRGGVEDYCQAMARHLAIDGVGLILMDGKGRDRTLSALRATKLTAIRITSIIPRPGLAPTYWIVEARHKAANLKESVFAMRDVSGEHWSPEYCKLRHALQLPNANGNAPYRNEAE